MKARLWGVSPASGAVEGERRLCIGWIDPNTGNMFLHSCHVFWRGPNVNPMSTSSTPQTNPVRIRPRWLQCYWHQPLTAGGATTPAATADLGTCTEASMRGKAEVLVCAGRAISNIASIKVSSFRIGYLAVDWSRMEWLNYHHLLYFWTVARKGSIARACEELHLAQPTISGQLRALEENLGEKLFARQGRKLVLTEAGQLVYGYAEEIFSLGKELKDVLQGRPRNHSVRLVVGLSDLIPKLIAYRILEPVLAIRGGVQIKCCEDTPEKLLLRLAAHELDLVVTDAPAYSAVRAHVFNHPLGSSRVALFAFAAPGPFLSQALSELPHGRAISPADEKFPSSPDDGGVV
jgi:DNA-binding transcriptional ArsR family regulator